MMDAHKIQEKGPEWGGFTTWCWIREQFWTLKAKLHHMRTSNSHGEIGSLHSQEVHQEVLLWECSYLEKKQGSLQL